MAQNVAAPNPLDVRLMHASTTLLISLLVLAVLGTAGATLAKSRWFDIRSVRVIGDTQHNNAETLRGTALSKLHGTYLTMDLNQARQVFEAVPWVKRAVVRRVWPHQLVVELIEHKPVALWERDTGEDHLVDVEGQVFEVNLGDVEDANLPTLSGPRDSAPQVLQMYGRLRPIVEGLGGSIERLSLSERGSWRLEFERGTVIELGRGSEDEVLQRTRNFAGTVSQVIATYGARAVESADLRHQDGYALRLAGVSVDSPASAAARKSKSNSNNNSIKRTPDGPGTGR